MRFRHLLTIVSTAALVGCGTIIHGGTQDIGIASSPAGAKITLDSMASGFTPFIAKLARKQNHIIRIESPGYAPAELALTHSVSGWAWGNIVFGGLIGLVVDVRSGGLYKLSPEQLHATLETQRSGVTPTKDGIYVVLVRESRVEWTKVGQLAPVIERVGE